MAVHAAGPRLYRSIKFHHLVRHTTGGARARNIALIVVTFGVLME
jgi:hypothetical protein